jgi:hypothetical protein
MALATCVSSLAPPAAALFRDPGKRQRASLPRRARWSLQRCVEHERDLHDLQHADRLVADLLNLVPAANRDMARAEAARIAMALIAKTRALDRQYQMVGSPLFHNFLIKMGGKASGYCFQWTRELHKALNDVSLQVFERVWGVAGMGGLTENNGVVIRVRGVEPGRPGEYLENAIVYDAWRGSGHPYWRGAIEDHYKWYIRLSEANVQAGVSDAIYSKEEEACNVQGATCKVQY